MFGWVGSADCARFPAPGAVSAPLILRPFFATKGALRWSPNVQECLTDSALLQRAGKLALALWTRDGMSEKWTATVHNGG